MTDTSPTPADRPADQLRAAAEPVPFRYVDEDGFCLSSRLLPDLDTGGTTGVVSITVEGSDEPQSAHVPVAELPKVLAGIAESAGLAVARQLLGTTEAEGADRCPRCDEDLTNYTEDDRVYRKGDTRPYCSGECVVFSWRNNLPIPSWATDLRSRIQAAIENYPVAAWTPENLAGRVMRVVETAAAPPAPADRAAGLRALADDAAAGVQPPTSEAQPARRRLTPNEYDRAWHAVEGSAGEPGADPGTVLHAVLRALRIDAPTPAEEQAASPSRRTTPPAAPAAPEEQAAPAEAEEAKPRLLWSDLLGADPDITGGACTQCYMDRARDRDHDMSPEHAHCRAVLDGDGTTALEEPQ
ncbi:hypothetical protein ACWD45_24940 [Streptomyces rubiginosohelvolus]